MSVFRRILLLSAFSILIVGCSGDDGAPGAAGPQGPAGPTGGQGPTGSPGGVPVTSAEKINVEISGVTAAAGAPAEVELFLSNDLGQGLTGMPPDNIRFIISQLTPGSNGGSSEWQSYITQDSGGIANAQATTETATDGTFVDNNDGSYTYTFANALEDYPAGPTFDPSKIHRLGLEIRTTRGALNLPENIPANNAPYDFIPGGGVVDPQQSRLIVDNDTCNACHDNLELHGEARFDVEYCVQCHNPSSIDGDTANTPWGGSVDMKVMIHKIHYGELLVNGYQVIGFGGTLHDYSDIVFPQDVRNCTTCHDDTDLASTPQAENFFTVVNRDACGTCHDNILDWSSQVTGHPNGLAFNDDEQCLDCHGPDSTVNNGELQVREVHKLKEVIAAAAFEFEVVSITDTAPGQTPTATIRVLNPTDPNYATDPASTAYDINDPAGPFQIGSARLRMDISWTSVELANLDPNNLLARSATSGAPFPPIDINFASGATNVGGNTFSKTAAAPIPTGIGGSGLAVLEGRASVDIDGSLDNLPVAADVLAFAITDAAAEPRRSVVNIDKCNDCHKNLALHGDNRSGNTEVCSTCHNPNATDINRRVAGSECDMELGLDDETIDLKRMVHAIHAGTIGVCGYRNTAHPYFGVVYPGRLNNCEGCHLSGTYYPVDPDQVLATTIDAGANRASLLDDVAISPNAAVCSSCHTSDLAKQHMIQNGSDFEAQKDENGTLIADGVETCQLCHGPGRSADVKEVHGVGEFLFN